MELIINFKDQKNVELELLAEGILVDKVSLSVGPDFDDLLIGGIDKILRKNKMDIASLKIVKVAGKERFYSTAYKIAQAVVSSLMFTR